MCSWIARRHAGETRGGHGVHTNRVGSAEPVDRIGSGRVAHFATPVHAASSVPFTSVGCPARVEFFQVLFPRLPARVRRRYQALFRVWRDKAMTVRVTYTLNGQTAGKEFEELRDLTGLLPMGFGDEMLRFNGLGERITLAMNNNNAPSQADKDAYYRIVRWAAERGMSLTMHWGSDSSVDHLLSIFERVNQEIPIAPLRWSIAHLNDASVDSLRRMKALGVGWTMQDAMYFGGEQFLKQAGAEAARRTPPVETARKMGVIVGAGTDAHRVASYNPFTALQWLLDGKTVGGVAMRGPEEIPSRLDALRVYTLGSAWFSFDDDERGSIEVGKLADLAVLSDDYMTIPVEKIGGLESELTMVGGRIVYSAGPFEGLDKKP